MTPREKIVAALRLAALSGAYSGLIRTPDDEAYFRRCRAVDHHEGVALIFTRDTGHHMSGWWKNPDYERCFHLSVSFFDPETYQAAPFRHDAARAWARMFFRHDTRWVWVEPPYSPEGRARGVHHYRLFCDAGWQPIKPRGEVYTKEFTEAGWRSFSEIHGERAKLYTHGMGNPG